MTFQEMSSYSRFPKLKRQIAHHANGTAGVPGGSLASSSGSTDDDAHGRDFDLQCVLDPVGR